MTAIYRLGGSQSAATITRGHTHTKFDPINSAVDTLTHVVDLLLHSQVKSQVEAVKLVDHVSLDVIDLNGAQYQNMRFGNNLAESMAFGYQFMREHLSQFQPDHQVLPRWTERRCNAPTLSRARRLCCRPAARPSARRLSSATDAN